MRKHRSRDREPEKYHGNYIIFVVGPAGAGKSSFINQLLGEVVVEVGNSINHSTTDLKPVNVPTDRIQQNLPLWDPDLARLIIVDTPGFDDDRVNDKPMLTRIADWLAKTYGADTQLAGAIYLQDISQQRVTLPTKYNFGVFDKLWGAGSCKPVVLGTTQWTSIPPDREQRAKAKCREQEIWKFWKDMLGEELTMQRVDDKNISPWKLVETVLLKGKSPTFQTKSKQASFERYQGCYIIPIMGPTGAGKSSFINLLLGKEVVEVGHSLNSCTTHLQPVEVPAGIIKQNLPQSFWDPTSTQKLIVVDTPGFDDTSANDSEILKRIADWLAESYGAGAKLAGIIYLQDICQRRITRATKRNFDVFDKLCGIDACKSVVLGTTQWTRILSDDREMAESREENYRKILWKDMISNGSSMHRVDDKNASPWNLVEIILKHKFPMLQIQREMVELKKSLPQTEAAQVLKGRIEEIVNSLGSPGQATQEEIQAFVQEVEELKEKPSFKRFMGHLFDQIWVSP